MTLLFSKPPIRGGENSKHSTHTWPRARRPPVPYYSPTRCRFLGGSQSRRPPVRCPGWSARQTGCWGGDGRGSAGGGGVRRAPDCRLQQWPACGAAGAESRRTAYSHCAARAKAEMAVETPLYSTPPCAAPRPPHVMKAMIIVKNATTKMRLCVSRSGDSHRSGCVSSALAMNECPMKDTMNVPIAIWVGRSGGRGVRGWGSSGVVGRDTALGRAATARGWRLHEPPSAAAVLLLPRN
jgi:hypothetical protein